MEELALDYWERGFRVIPGGSLYERPPNAVIDRFGGDVEAACRGWIKRPRVRWKEFQDRDPTREEIEVWWAKYPGANVLIVTGCGVDVVDADSAEAIAWVESGEISRTPYKVRTRKGAHYYYQTGPDILTRANPEAGLDTRGRGGYVVAGGSLYWSDDNKACRYVIEAPPGFSEPADLPTLTDQDVRAVARHMGRDPDAERKCVLAPELEGSLDADRATEIRAALAFISPDCGRDEWIRIGMALKSTGGGLDAFRIWVDWSLSSKVHAPQAHELRYQWDHITVGGGIAISTLFEAAKRNGCDLKSIAPKTEEVLTWDCDPVPGTEALVSWDEHTRKVEALPQDLDEVTAPGEILDEEKGEVVKLRRPKSEHPFDEIRDADEFAEEDLPPVEYSVEGFLLRKSLMMLSASRGLGKSQVAMHLAQAIADGSDFFGWEVKEPRRVLFFDGEMSLPMLQERLRMFLPERHPQNLQFLTDGHLALAKMETINLASIEGRAVFVEGLKRLRERGRLPEVIILDNVSALTQGLKEDDNTEVRAFTRWFKWLRALGFTVVYVHHAGKDGKARGASAWAEYAELAVELQPVDETGRAKPEAEFLMDFTKVRGRHPLDGQGYDRLWAKLSRESGMWMFGDPKGERGDLHKTEGGDYSALDDDIDHTILKAIRSCMAWMPSSRVEGITGRKLEDLLRTGARLSKRQATRVRQAIHDPRYRALVPQIESEATENKRGAIYWVDRRAKGSPRMPSE